MSVQNVGAILVLGDLVGYGPAPADVLNEVYSRAHGLVMGNHEGALAGLMDSQAFNPAARRGIEWTRSQISSRALRLFARMPLALAGRTFLAVHASPLRPGCFEYIWDENAAAAVFDACDARLVFCGHTHVPRIFVQGNSGRTHRLDPVDFAVEPGKRYIVDVGSVGLPRDGDPRASYCVYDEDAGNIFFRRVAFDVQEFRQELEACALPLEPFAAFDGGMDALPPVRQRVDFRPPSVVSRGLRGDRVRSLERCARRWRGSAVAAGLAAVAALGMLLYAPIHKKETQQNRPITVAAAFEGQLRSLDPGTAVALPFEKPAESRSGALRLWGVELGDPQQQGVILEAGSDGTKWLRLHSAAAERMVLESVAARCDTGARYTAALSLRAKKPWSGSVRLLIVGRDSEGGERVLAARELRASRPNRWRRTSVTMPKQEGGAPASVKDVCVRLETRFVGDVDLRDARLSRRE